MKVYKYALINLSRIFLMTLIAFSVFELSSSSAVPLARTWDGGGSTNNWSDAGNWSGDVVPGSGDEVVFDSTSTKNATIDINFTVRTLNVNSGYTGIITQAGGTTLTIGDGSALSSSLADGTFVCGSGALLSLNGGTFTQTGGQFNCQNGAINGNFFNLKIDGGTFDAPSGTMTFNGASSLELGAGGTFNHSSGTIVATGNFLTFRIINGAPATLEINNLTVSFTTNAFGAVALNEDGDRLRILGALNLIKGDTQGTFEAQGAVNISDTWGNNNQTGKLQITGAATRTITLPTLGVNDFGQEIFYVPIELNAPNVTVNTSGAGPVRLKSFDLISGTINTGTIPFSLGTTSSFRDSSQSGGTFRCDGLISFNAVNFTQVGGLFDCKNGTINSNFVNLFLNGGTFDAPSGTMTIQTPAGAEATIQRGGPAVFRHNNGTVIFAGETAFLKAVNGASNEFDFNNLTVNVNNLLSLTNGNVKARVLRNLNLTSGMVFGGSLESHGDVTVGSGFRNSAGNDASLTFAGSNNQTYTNNGGGDPRGTWTVDKTGGTVTAASSLILQTNQNLLITRGRLFLNDGSNLTAGVLNIEANGRLINESSTTITLGGDPINNGTLDLQGGGAGCPQSDSILLRSSLAGARRNWSGSGVFRLVDVDVQDMRGSDAASPPTTVFSCTDRDNNTNWNFNTGCPPDVSITPSNVSVIVTNSQAFSAGGGFAPYTFSLVTNSSGGSINSATGQYMAGTTPSVSDTVRVTDFFGAIVDATVNVTTGPPAQLVFTVQPTNTQAGQIMTSPPQVALRDQFGNTVPAATNSVTVEARVNNVLVTAFTHNAVNGVAVFPDIRIDLAAGGYTLRATASGLATADSTSFNIIPGAPATLRYVTHPGNANALAIISPAVEVAVEDDFGNRIFNATNPVTLSLQNNPGGAVLSGTLSRNAVNGLATFDNLSLNRVGNQYTLIATSPNLLSRISNPFNIARPDFVVTNILDGGAGSLRQAILDANGLNGADRIIFNISGSAPHTITLSSNLPQIIEAVFIDGNTQPDFAGTPVVEITGVNNPGSSGLHFTSGGGSTVRGLTVNRFDTQIRIEGNGGNSIYGNFIGTDATGTSQVGPASNVGIHILSDNNLIGGTTVSNPFARNIVVGGSAGIDVQIGNGNQIQGNFIGTDVVGFRALGGSATGVRVRSGANTRIGGEFAGESNVISGNQVGVVLESPSGSMVQGNFIGTTADGILALPNLTGISVKSSNNVIGGATSAHRNVISGNTVNGIALSQTASANTIRGNTIGGNLFSDPLANETGILVVASGNQIRENEIVFNTGKGVSLILGSSNFMPIQNAIFANRIHSNGGLGISLSGATSPRPNDPGDTDEGQNRGQNFPVLSLATSNGTSTNIQGTLNSTPHQSFTLHFYSNHTCDASGFGEGETLLGATNVTTDASGLATLNTTLPVDVPLGRFITATATDSEGNTSEFSHCKDVSPAYVSISGVLTNSSNAPLTEVLVKLGGTQKSATLTNSNGEYTFDKLTRGGNYTVTPVLPNFDFSPPNRSHTNLLTDQTGQNFIGTKTRFSVSGQVTTISGGATVPQSGVTMTLSGTVGRTVTTNTNGNYIINGLPAGSYTLTPSKQGFVFTPGFHDLTISNSDVVKDFNAEPATPLEGRIVFASWGGLASINADGSALYYTRNDSTDPSLSRDGRKIVCVSHSHIIAMNADNTGRVRIGDTPFGAFNPEWSPDATKIAFVNSLEIGIGLFLMNADGSGQTPIPVGGLTLPRDPTWLSSTRLAFTAHDGNDSEIYSVNTDGTGLTQLTNNSVFDFGPAASPDGTKIVFNRKSTQNSTTASLLVMNADGTGQVTISDQNDLWTTATWSPDGTKIAFVHRPTSTGQESLVAVNSGDGSGMQTIINTAASFPSWSQKFEFDTPVGNNVHIQAGGASITFSGVTTAGTTTITPISDYSAAFAPNGFVIGDLGYEISTTAAYTAPVGVCFNVPPLVAPTQTDFDALGLLHNEGGVRVDRTTTRNFFTRTICGQVSTLSPFVLGEFVNPNLASIIGAVVDADGNPMSGVLVQLTGTEARDTQTDNFGRFSLVNLSEGDYQLKARQFGYIFAPNGQSFTGISGANTIVFEGTPTNFNISGRVTNESGAGISNISVELSGAFFDITTTNSNGEYTLANLPAGGSYTVMPSRGNVTFAPRQIFIESLTSDISGANFRAAAAPQTGPLARLVSLKTLLLSFNLERGITNSLKAKLDTATQALQAGDAKTACNALRSFINEVEAQTGKKITSTQAGQLIFEANAIRGLIGCN